MPEKKEGGELLVLSPRLLLHLHVLLPLLLLLLLLLLHPRLPAFLLQLRRLQHALQQPRLERRRPQYLGDHLRWRRYPHRPSRPLTMRMILLMPPPSWLDRIRRPRHSPAGSSSARPL